MTKAHERRLIMLSMLSRMLPLTQRRGQQKICTRKAAMAQGSKDNRHYVYLIKWVSH
jgi:hypothetical protein